MRDAIHKWTHRFLAFAIAAVGLLQQAQAIDLAHLLGEAGALKAAAIIGGTISALEFLPILANFVASLTDPD